MNFKKIPFPGLDDLLLLIGIAGIGYGTWLEYGDVAYIVVGVILSLLGFLSSSNGKRPGQ